MAAMQTTSNYSVHPAAELFPLIEGEDFAELVEDIRLNGLLEPISRTPDGRILDGRNRYRACQAAGIEPVYQEHDGDPWAFVVSRNLHRRHLTGTQRAMVAAKIAERGRGERVSAGTANQPIDGFALPGKTSGEQIPTQAQAAALLNTSTTSVHRARVVLTKGTGELAQLVEEGRVSVHAAERAAQLPTEEQAEFVEAVRSGAKPHTAIPNTERQENPTKPDEPTPAPRQSPRIGTKTYYNSSGVLSRDAAFKLVYEQAVFEGLRSFTSLDAAITGEEAARWAGDLSKAISHLRRLIKMLKEHNK